MSEQHNVSIRINDKPVELPKGHYTQGNRTDISR